MFKLKIIAPPVTSDPFSEPSPDDDELPMRYCGKPMRSACIEQGGFLGICRQCFIYHHCMERNKDGPAKRNESKF